MIIDCGNRRLVSNRFGWKIEILAETKKGEKVWREDRPAYPASLAAACETLCERILTDGGDCTIAELPERLILAASAVRRYMECARKAA